MVKAKAIKALFEPVFCCVDDMGLCWWVVKVEFWYFFDAEKTEVVVWPVCEGEPILVGAVFVVLCVFEKRVLC